MARQPSSEPSFACDFIVQRQKKRVSVSDAQPKKMCQRSTHSKELEFAKNTPQTLAYRVSSSSISSLATPPYHSDKNSYISPKSFLHTSRHGKHEHKRLWDHEPTTTKDTTMADAASTSTPAPAAAEAATAAPKLSHHRSRHLARWRQIADMEYYDLLGVRGDATTSS